MRTSKYPDPKEGSDLYHQLDPLSKAWLRLGGRLKIRDENLIPSEPDNPSAPIYLFWCGGKNANDLTHGAQVDYPHGYNRLDCSECKRQQALLQAMTDNRRRFSTIPA